MSVSFADKLPNAVIPVGAAVSNVFDATYMYGDAALLGISGLDSQQSKTFTIEVSVDNSAWSTLQAGTTLADMAVPAQGKADTYTEPLAWPYLRIKASGNAASNPITFGMSRNWTAGN